MNNKAHTPLFHVSRRAALPWYGAWGIRAAALIIALLACALITNLITGLNPLEVYATIWQGSFGSARRTWVLFQNIAMLLCVSLAITPAFRMRCWNLGGDGQMLIGCLATTACMILLGGKLPNGVVILCMFVSSVLAGAVWAAIPAFFKAKWNTNETLFTLMMNYIATQLVAYYIIIWEVPKGAGKIGIINQSTQAGWLPQIGSYKYLLNILIVAVVCVLMYVYLNYSKHGYEIAVVGESERTARYVGIKVDRVIIRTMFLSGAVCGLAGMLLVGHAHHHHHLRTRLHRRHGLLAGQVQSHLDDSHQLPAGLPRTRRRPDRHQFRPERLLCRHPHGPHPVLHHRQRVFHQLSDQVPPRRGKGGLSHV